MGSWSWGATAGPVPSAATAVTTPHADVVASVQSSEQRHHGSRPDWILYAVPGAAFLLGLGLFALLLRTNRRRWSGALVRQRGFDTRRRADIRYPPSRTDGEGVLPGGTVAPRGGTGRCAHAPGGAKADSVSYENVDAAIYANQPGGSCRAATDDKDDYVIPDTDEDAHAVREGHAGALPPARRYATTDGGSYENMVGAVYAEPRRRRTTGVADDRGDQDYLDPDAAEGGQDGDYDDYLCPVKQPCDTDGESYEDMDRSCLARPQEEEDSYEKMDSIPAARDALESKRSAREGGSRIAVWEL